MQSERAPLVLEQGAGMRLDECRQCQPRGGEHGVAIVRAAALAGGATALDAVQTRRGEYQGLEQRVQRLDTAAAHQRDGTFQPARDLGQQGLERLADDHLGGSFLKLHQGSVNVEE